VDRGGSILFFAPTKPGINLSVPINDFWRDGIKLTPSYGSSPRDTVAAIELIRAGRIPVKKMITHQLSLAEIGLGFKLVEEAKESIKNEAKVLKTLNKHKIGPRFVAKGDTYLIYDFVEGEYIKDWLPKNNKEKIKKVFKEVLKQCHTLDKMKLNKEEMHHPLKHVIIDKSVTMIDFERTHKSKSPKNVTQFLQFIRTNANMLNRRGFSISKEKILEISQNYKKDHRIDYVFKELGL